MNATDHKTAMELIYKLRDENASQVQIIAALQKAGYVNVRGENNWNVRNLKQYCAQHDPQDRCTTLGLIRALCKEMRLLHGWNTPMAVVLVGEDGIASIQFEFENSSGETCLLHSAVNELNDGVDEFVTKFVDGCREGL